MIKVRVVLPDGRTLERELSADSVLIGRSPRADLSLPDPSLSREHARLVRDGDGWMIEDVGSRNGTFVNGQQVRGPARLGVGDTVTLGTVSLSLVPEEPAVSLQEGGHPEHTVLRSMAELLKESGVQAPAAAPTADAEALRRIAERLRIVNEVHQALASSISLDDLIELILDRAFESLRPEQGAIFLRQPDGEYRCVASRSVSGSEKQFVYSKSLIHEVVDKGMAALVLDTAVDSRFNQAMSLLSVGVRSLIAAPLMDDKGALGMIALGSRVTVRAFSEEDLELLVPLASVAALRIRNVALADEAAQRRRLEEEVKLARRIQVALLPDELPKVEGYEIHGGNVPSRFVSGDYYEVIPRLGGKECVILLADVSGKGIGAALLTASVEALSVAPIEDGASPAAVCSRVSRLLFERTPAEKYATVFLAALEPASGRLTYCNAGHCPGLLIPANGEPRWLESTGMPVGLLPTATFNDGEDLLQPGDMMLVYTDGITEATNPQDEEYGRERLAAVCARSRLLPLKTLAQEIERDLEAFASGEAFADDRTVVMVRRLP